MSDPIDMIQFEISWASTLLICSRSSVPNDLYKTQVLVISAKVQRAKLMAWHHQHTAILAPVFGKDIERLQSAGLEISASVAERLTAGLEASSNLTEAGAGAGEGVGNKEIGAAAEANSGKTGKEESASALAMTGMSNSASNKDFNSAASLKGISSNIGVPL
ncbi:hypothetical protein WICPIJ_009371 [Wickerhamomyces pijperi]|uniref:Uncharacterized protein n=1 Tax=Wickerhamomyces pijperi TaxID=599730 RepID=A0A9P8PP04_WICPI|nr:hypothetical protein WICPIJ_009371 [Wickerhamomyces pijperi]